LGNDPKNPPWLAWQNIQTQTWRAFEETPEEAQELWDKYQPDQRLIPDSMELDLLLQNLPPDIGLNNFQYLNKTVDLKDVLKAKPLDVLEGVLRMVTISDKWQTEVAP
jgi:hypothetical protein